MGESEWAELDAYGGPDFSKKVHNHLNKIWKLDRPWDDRQWVRAGFKSEEEFNSFRNKINTEVTMEEYKRRQKFERKKVPRKLKKEETNE